MKLFCLPMIINYARYEFNHLLTKSGNVLKIETSSLAIKENIPMTSITIPAL